MRIAKFDGAEFTQSAADGNVPKANYAEPAPRSYAELNNYA